MIVTAAAAIFFGALAIMGALAGRAICAGVEPAADGPATGTPPYAVLVVGSALIGGFLLAAKFTPLEIGIAAIVLFALVACWCTDVICGMVPDAFTLVPLAALLLFSFAQHDWWIAFSAAIAFAPFAVAALFTRGYGMGWGDAKLVALCGAALGAPVAAMALAVACAAAVVGYRLAGAARSPIAFAPYIAAATAVALPLGLAH
ncbi:MAG: prepilin peptidase [Candidatus Eremiobacteraeota bacterium]|nr:prepilin peptidase [Candidatus Eremiobacteraeota bacterium]